MGRMFWSGLLVFLSIAPSRSTEPWTDKRLPDPARDGLLLWLDASAQNFARQSLKQPPLNALSPVDACYDGSGKKWHLTQDQKDFRPNLQLMGEVAAMRFDGTDDFLARKAEKRELKDLTLIVVAATYSNQGGFRAYFAGNEPGKNDYTSGINFDLGPFFSNKVQMLNSEGPGFGGAANLLKQPADFGKFHRFALVSSIGPDGIKLYVNGLLTGSRRRNESVMRLDELTLGARRYSNEARPPFVQGFLDGDIAEVLLFDRVISEDQRRAIDKYLADKYVNAVPIPPAHVGPPGSKPLVTVKDPPPVQMLIPGFTVRELPVDLPNINNVRYGPKGLFALGYNGNIYLLTDSDGDGLEDKVELWYENKGSLISPIGMAVTPEGFKHGQGVIVAAKGKVLLIVDSKGTGKGDKEIIVADNWEPYPPEMQTHGVDALGVAIDKEGAVYFGLGCKSYVNGYLLDKDGKSHYDLKSERGTILKVSPDFKKREIVCTGIRFPVGLAFNSEGDLFCTDQEGATWLPNGNPFDELLHIQPGRHYGFPPRHPKHLPNVIDEPSTFDYSPQHQSTCGFAFNGPLKSPRKVRPLRPDEMIPPIGPLEPNFGPFLIWCGDAIVTGYSRGKLFRTKFVKSDAGYVAQNQLIACLNMLAVDCCISGKGELIVAAHSGAPDWGNGPSGKGKIYKIKYDDRQPQPVLVWPQSANEVHIAFDKPFGLRHLSDLAKQTKIEYGKYVRAGDRFESLRPGYAVVQQQMAAPRYELPVLGASVSWDRRTLILNTAPHPEATHYAVTLPGMDRPDGPTAGALPQHPQIDLAYTLNGVQAEW